MSHSIERVSPNDITVRIVEGKLRAFNEAAVGLYAYEPVALVLRDAAGAVGGGFLGGSGLAQRGDAVG